MGLAGWYGFSARVPFGIARSVGCQLPRADNYHELLYRKPEAKRPQNEDRRNSSAVRSVL